MVLYFLGGSWMVFYSLHYYEEGGGGFIGFGGKLPPPPPPGLIPDIERLAAHFFAANGHTEAANKKAILLTVTGPTAYKIRRSLTTRR